MIRFEKLLLEISTRLANLSAQQIGPEIEKGLGRIARSQVHHREHDQRHAEQDRHHPDDTAEKNNRHADAPVE